MDPMPSDPGASPASGPHQGGRVVRAGAEPSGARLALVLLHGRGGGPEDMIGLGRHVAGPDVALVAPEARGNSWWPASFLAPEAENEPYATSALTVVADLVAALEADGLPAGRIVLAGFSQGGCLALETAARLARPFKGVVGLSAGLIGTGTAPGGPDPALYGHAPKRMDYPGRLDGVPVRVAVHERDPHIPIARARQSVEAFAAMGASARINVHPGAGHQPMPDDLEALRALLA